MALASNVYGVDKGLILGVIAQESMFHADAEGCLDEEGQPECFGLMQVHQRGAGWGWPVEVLRRPCPNIVIGTSYLAKCKEAYPDSVAWQLACYQQGLGGPEINGLDPSLEYIGLVLHYAKIFWQKETGDNGEESSYQDPL